MDTLLQVEHLVKRFILDKRTAIWAVNDVSFFVKRGETLALVGESGSGKTTVGRCVIRLIEPDSGTIRFDGTDLSSLSERQMRVLRHRIAIVFQEPYDSLNPRRSVKQTIQEPLALQNALSPDEREQRLRETLTSVQLSESHLPRFPGQLTASEQQRLAIARAIVTRPDLIVVDEATSNLDPGARAEILDVFVALQRQFGVSYLFISHDLTAVEKVSHRIAIMYLGRIVEMANADTLFSKQLHPYSKGLLSSVLYPDPKRKLEPFNLTGEIPTAINPPDECSLVSRCPFAQPGCRQVMPSLEEIEKGHFVACYRSTDFMSSGVPSALGASSIAGK